MVRAMAMKTSKGFPRGRRRRSDAGRRDQLLAAFDRSGLSAAAFAREQKLNYTTFCGWRQRRGKSKASPGFVEIELPTPTAAGELVIELGGQTRLRIHSPSQMALAAGLVQALNALAAC